MMPAPPPPICPNGHGAMERTPGLWALQGVMFEQPPVPARPICRPNGDGVVLKLWSCPVCKLVHLYDDDTDDTPAAPGATRSPPSGR